MADKRFELPGKIECCLAALSKLYAQHGNRSHQEIIVNAQAHVTEGYSYDAWNGGTHGHALHLIIPELIYLANFNQREAVQHQIVEDLNKLHNVPKEFIAAAFLEMDVLEESDWRQASGLLIMGTRPVSSEATKRLWEADYFRLFLSHKDTVKREAAQLRDKLRQYGISAFVAHEDIHPTKEWQDEIENALATMDGFVALMTPDFHDSYWTDQEVGYALARGVPIVPVRMGQDPYGFLGKFQGLTTSWDLASEGLVKLLINSPRMLSSFIGALRRCSSYDCANALSQILSSIASLSEKQIDDVIEAFNGNDQLRSSYGFNGEKPRFYGTGLLPHLHRWGDRRYIMTGTQLIVHAQSPLGFGA